jgi:hypothetical protein
MIVALLIVPIYLLYNLVKDTDGKLDDHATRVCIAILLVCTLLFSGVQPQRKLLLLTKGSYLCELMLTATGTALFWLYFWET